MQPQAMTLLEPGHRMTLEAEQGWLIAERFQSGELLLVLTDASPNLGGLLAEVQRCCEHLARGRVKWDVQVAKTSGQCPDGDHHERPQVPA